MTMVLHHSSFLHLCNSRFYIYDKLFSNPALFESFAVYHVFVWMAGLNVVSHVAFLVETQRTVRAGVRLFPSMSLNVSAVVMSAWELLETNGAVVRLSSLVCMHVKPQEQATGCIEGTVTARQCFVLRIRTPRFCFSLSFSALLIPASRLLHLHLWRMPKGNNSF